MNFVLFLSVICFFSYLAWEQRNTYVTIHIPFFRKMQKKQKRVFKTFRFIETSKGIRCYEESRYRIV